jgi:hypothetical protein
MGRPHSPIRLIEGANAVVFMVILSLSLSSRLAALCMALLALAACGQDPRPAAPEPTLLAPTVEQGSVTATGIPRATVTTLLPAPPVTVTSAPTPCAYDYFFTPAPAPCPREAAVETAAAEQPFTGGLMIWLEAHDAIYILYPGGAWQRFADTWSAAEAEGDPALAPPDGLYQPVRGFGKVWREQPEVREALGWATSPELGFTSQVQRPVSAAGEQVTFVQTFNGQVYYLYEVEPDSGTWGIAASW